jgi:hypothetical protein
MYTEKWDVIKRLGTWLPGANAMQRANVAAVRDIWYRLSSDTSIVIHGGCTARLPLFPPSPGQNKQADLGQYIIADYCFEKNILRNLRHTVVFIVQISLRHCY